MDEFAPFDLDPEKFHETATKDMPAAIQPHLVAENHVAADNFQDVLLSPLPTMGKGANAWTDYDGGSTSEMDIDSLQLLSQSKSDDEEKVLQSSNTRCQHYMRCLRIPRLQRLSDRRSRRRIPRRTRILTYPPRLHPDGLDERNSILQAIQAHQRSMIHHHL